MPISRRPAKILQDFESSEFENLIFDLAVAKGMVNVVWRTPGADGGRDIEAESLQTDLAGAHSFTRWYIECKRYTGSVDWPTIHPKLAYADAAKAEYLLLCTTSKFTPQAINNTNLWNADRRYPKLRLWAGHDIISRLAEHQDLAYRYGLAETLERPGRSIVDLSLALSKSVGTFYSAECIKSTIAHPMLRAAFALSLLLQVRMEDADAGQNFRLRALEAVGELGIDVEPSGTPQNIDEPSFAAFVAYLRALTRARLRLTFAGPGMYTVVGSDKFAEVLTRYRPAFSAIALWGDFEFTFTDTEIKVKQR